jgi:uncharacterized membrane protein YozB (DUF420 family)
MKPADIIDETNTRITMPETSKSAIAVSPVFISAMLTGIISLIVLIHIGFSRSYIQYFPKFESTTGPLGPVEFNWIMHIHGMIMMSWVMMLLVQPILIRKGKRDLHRRVGRFSYVLAPLVVLSIYLANYDGYHKVLKEMDQTQAVALLSLTFPGLVFFAILYSLAIYYKHKPSLHMRFMCSTAFLFIPPALDRTLIYFFQLPGYDVGSFIELGIIALVVTLDAVKTKRVSPFLLVFSFELLHVTFWNIKFTAVWQVVGGVIAHIF